MKPENSNKFCSCEWESNTESKRKIERNQTVKLIPSLSVGDVSVCYAAESCLFSCRAEKPRAYEKNPCEGKSMQRY